MQAPRVSAEWRMVLDKVQAAQLAGQITAAQAEHSVWYDSPKAVMAALRHFQRLNALPSVKDVAIDRLNHQARPRRVNSRTVFWLALLAVAVLSLAVLALK